MLNVLIFLLQLFLVEYIVQLFQSFFCIIQLEDFFANLSSSLFKKKTEVLMLTKRILVAFLFLTVGSFLVLSYSCSYCALLFSCVIKNTFVVMHYYAAIFLFVKCR